MIVVVCIIDFSTGILHPTIIANMTGKVFTVVKAKLMEDDNTVAIECFRDIPPNNFYALSIFIGNTKQLKPMPR